MCQLQEVGNVDQIKYYLDLFSQAFLMRLIFKWSTTLKSRTSSPKLLPGAPVFTSIFVGRDLTDEQRGRIFEAVVGNRLCETFDIVYYWREGNYELDFVVEHEGQMIGVEVKSKIRKSSSLSFFRAKVPTAKTCIIDMLNYKDFENNPIEFLTQMSV
ncbi:MAG: DUF4143 domain-containing protein [Bdellovibrionales bacterium]